MTVRYRMYESVSGAVVDVASEDGKHWYHVAVFKHTPEAERCYPGARFISYCAHCAEPHYGEPDACPECCEHGEYDHGICGYCGEDCTDELAGMAESFFEGDR